MEKIPPDSSACLSASLPFLKIVIHGNFWSNLSFIFSKGLLDFFSRFLKSKKRDLLNVKIE